MLFDSLMMRGIVEYNPAARARPPRLVRESSHTPVFEEAEIVGVLLRAHTSFLLTSVLGLDKPEFVKRHSG